MHNPQHQHDAVFPYHKAYSGSAAIDNNGIRHKWHFLPCDVKLLNQLLKFKVTGRRHRALPDSYTMQSGSIPDYFKAILNTEAPEHVHDRKRGFARNRQLNRAQSITLFGIASPTDQTL